MPSLLASQLAKSVSLNAPLLSETARKKHYASSSYLFSASSKAQIDDLDTIHALALNALAQLKRIYPSLSVFDEQSHVYRNLFSQRARETDRTLLAAAELKELNDAIRTLLRALGCCLMVDTTGRVIEWLVRRFRVNEFNAPDILALFFPYHESPHFAKMVSILTIDDRAPWRFLSAYKAAGKALRRSELATEMLKEKELARFFVGLLPEAGVHLHRTLVSFNLSTVFEFLTRADRKELDAGTLAFLLPALLEPLKAVDSDSSDALIKDCILSSYVLLAALSQKCSFTADVVRASASAMIHSASGRHNVEASQLLTALISFMGVQDMVDDLPGSAVDELVVLPDIIETIERSLQWANIDKVLIPTLRRLFRKQSESDYSAMLEFLLTHSGIPDGILIAAAKLLLSEFKDVNLLSAMHQRYPEIMKLAVEELVSEGKGDRAEFESAVMSLVMPADSARTSKDVLLAASNADASIRAGAVRQIVQLQREGAGSMSPAELTAFQDTLRVRAYDSSAEVLDVLYSAPGLIIPLFTSESALADLGASLSSSGATARHVLRAHLAFFCGPFAAAHPELSGSVLRALVLPHALFTKPRGRTAALVWATIGSSALGTCALLKGTSEVVQKMSGSLDHDIMASVNSDLAQKLAANIKASDDYASYLDWLVSGLKKDTETHQKLFSLLILQALLVELKFVDRIDAAARILAAINASVIGSIEEDVLDPDSLASTIAKGIVVKPSSLSTMQKMQLLLLLSISALQCPANIQIEWFSQDSKVEKLSIGSRYLYLIKGIYAALNSSSANPNLVAYANRILFRNLSSDVLLFLAGIWTSSETGGRYDANVTRYVALRHALAFLRGQAQATDGPVDFQAVLPALLSALHSADRQVRAAALECVDVLSKAETGSKPKTIYAYDQVYGIASADLQYLDWSDVCKYLKVIGEHKDHLRNDKDYIAVLHHDYLSYAKGQGKKETKHQQRVLSFLLSHVLCCPSLEIRLALLSALCRVSDGVKLQMLLPIIDAYVKARTNGQSSNECQDVVAFALEAYDRSSAKDLKDGENRAWQLLMQILELCYSDEHSVFLRKSVALVLRDTFFAHLSGNRQSELSLKLVEIGSIAEDAIELKQMLRSAVKDPALIASLLQIVRPRLGENVERASKRPKTDKSAPVTDENPLAKLSFLLEVLSSQDLPGSVELLAALLETLSGLVSATTTSQAEFIYAEQLLMSCMDSVASRIEKLPSHSSSSVRLDVLVEVMRTSENPQTFHQALLLMATLARLSPESVLHNIMPIFTFMGSNVFHRDDSHSFKVIQKTTESIVPVATASFREKHDNSLDRYIASRDLLRVFTDAFTHIPRHRRTSFFIHLVDVLDPAEFLAPVLMLLADKMANRVPRQNERDAETSLALPLSVSRHYDLPRRLPAIREVALEAKRLMKMLQDSTLPEKVFLDTTVLEDQTIPLHTIRKRQCQTLLRLIGIEMKQSAPLSEPQELRDGMRDIIETLLVLAAVEESANQDIKDVSESAQWALLQSMRIISVPYFSSIVLSMLSNENVNLQRGALGLLTSRLPDVEASAREAISSDIAQIVDRIQQTLRQNVQDTVAVTVGTEALLAITSTSCQKEEAALTNTIPVLVDCFKVHPDMPQPMVVISALTTRMGPRILPYLHSLVTTCIDSLKLVGTTQNGAAVSECLHALSCLLKTVPTFWGMADVKALIDLYINGETLLAGHHLAQLEKLVKLFAKQVPSKVLISSTMQCWPALDEVKQPNGTVALGRFFDLLKRCMHFTPRSDLFESLRSLFANFLISFDVRSRIPASEASELEDRIITSFDELVIKMNETTFSPLFRRLCDWAFGDESTIARQLTLCRIYSTLLELFKELMTPYMSLLSNHFKDLLESYQNKEKRDKDLWLASLDTLSKAFSFDGGVYWRDEKLRLLSGPLVQQISVCVSLKIGAGNQALETCINALVDCLEDDSSAKSVNHAVLMQTRSEDTRVRLLALSCAVSMWQAHGAKLKDYGQETATFIIECAEDDNDDVVSECRRLKAAVEAQVGKIDGL